MAPHELAFTIGDTPVSTDSVYFIAEAGVNHDGDLEVARDLVDIAAASGADAVKFQTFMADRVVTESAPMTEYQTEKTGVDSQHELLTRYELSREDHRLLQAHCHDRDVTFLSTPFDGESAVLLDTLEVPAFKLGSGDLTNHPLLRTVAAFGRPMIVSTGMGTLAEISAALDVIEDVDMAVDVALLHCTTAYPADLHEVNLRAMSTMSNEFGVPVGYSDHTLSVEMPGFATAAGALIVEKHFTHDRSAYGPDHHASLEPDELAEAVDLARQAATARGSTEKAPTESEREIRYVVRKSLHAAKEIAAGETIGSDDIAIKRPADGLNPSRFDGVIGRRTASRLARDDPITEDSLE